MLRIEEDPVDEVQKVLLHIKSSWGVYGKPLGFRIERDDPAGRFRWTGVSDLSLEDIKGRRGGREPKAADEAVQWLSAELRDGPRPTKNLNEAADEAGISAKAQRAARNRLKVVARKVGHVWWQCLPDRLPDDWRQETNEDLADKFT